MVLNASVTYGAIQYVPVHSHTCPTVEEPLPAVVSHDLSSLHLQVITTLLACRPRYSPEASYFITTYRKEYQCLQAHYQLVQSLIEHQLTEERTSHWQTSGGAVFGLPPPLIPKQLVSLSGDKRLLIHTYLLEFCNSLSIVASLPTAIQWALSEVVSLLRF